MIRDPDHEAEPPPGGRAAERLRQHMEARFPSGPGPGPDDETAEDESAEDESAEPVEAEPAEDADAAQTEHHDDRER